MNLFGLLYVTSIQILFLIIMEIFMPIVALKQSSFWTALKPVWNWFQQPKTYLPKISVNIPNILYTIIYPTYKH